MSPLKELRGYLSRWATRSRTARSFAELLHIEVVEDIAAEVQELHTVVGAQAHAAQHDDNEAARHLDAVLADGVVEPHEIALLELASKHVKRSAALDHHISKRLLS